MALFRSDDSSAKRGNVGAVPVEIHGDISWPSESDLRRVREGRASLQISVRSAHDRNHAWHRI
jgi:hypothetical protein